MQFLDTRAEAYAKKMTSPLDPVFAENERITLNTHPHAQMHSGHLQGKLLEMISRMIKPSKILEIGTFTGFSALCLSSGLAPGGRLHTIELREEDAAFARKYFAKASRQDSIELHVGNALEIIPKLDEKWDLVFIDADKVNYIAYYELTLPMLNAGGWILADNTLFHGDVLGEEIKGKNAVAIHAFNSHVAADPRVEQVMLTVRDGLTLVRKI